MIGLIVDGEGDYAAFRARYRGVAKIFRTDGPRGHEVSAEQIVDGARKQILQLRDLGCNRVAIVTDLEARQLLARSFKERCRAHAAKSNHSADLMIFVADRMLENWVLADISHISSKKSYLKSIARQKIYESVDGKSVLKKMFVKGHSYNEVRHGQDLFPLVRGENAASVSPSFADFRRETGLD